MHGARTAAHKFSRRASEGLSSLCQVFCSVPDLETSLQEIKRVLKPGGKLLYWDHVLADESKPLLRLGQKVLTPLQQALADGCHLNRYVTSLA